MTGHNRIYTDPWSSEKEFRSLKVHKGYSFCSVMETMELDDVIAFTRDKISMLYAKQHMKDYVNCIDKKKRFIIKPTDTGFKIWRWK